MPTPDMYTDTNRTELRIQNTQTHPQQYDNAPQIDHPMQQQRTGGDAAPVGHTDTYSANVNLHYMR
jgi:hypothetical protein